MTRKNRFVQIVQKNKKMCDTNNENEMKTKRKIEILLYLIYNISK